MKLKIRSKTERWFEIDASRCGARHFDKKYGSGAPGYKKKNPDFFDRESFENGVKTPYSNPRNNLESQGPNPTHGGKVIFWDFIL